MKFITEFRDSGLLKKMIGGIKKISAQKINIMEICGGHTMAIKKNGLDAILSDEVKFLSGPGCPVCVTDIRDIDRVIALSGEKDAVIATFGDLLKVPGTKSSLLTERAKGADIRVCYSILDCLKFAEEEPARKFIFASIGFETTTPTVAAGILGAKARGLKNFFVYAMNKTVPIAIRALLSDPDNKIEAFILPGHVSAIIGEEVYGFIAKEFGIPCAISGFEPFDILAAVSKIILMKNSGVPAIENMYGRGVRKYGNEKAREIMYSVFEECDVKWRGIGLIPGSGLRLKKKLAAYDAAVVFKIPEMKSKETGACLCGEVLKGKKSPKDCKLFGKVCTPENPKGACMVSSEGACAAWYLYDVK